MGKELNLTGQKFGKLTVLKLSYTKRYTYWKCLCDCGIEKIILGTRLTAGRTRSCGCLAKTNGIKHGMRHTRSYKSWQGMKSRCLNKSVSSYKDYGGRGIKICKKWMKFENFYKDMGNRPNGTSLDRINNNKGYYKKNCKWSTPEEQNINKRNNHCIYYKGRTMTISEWAKILNINPGTLHHRIFIYKWSIEKAFLTPIKRRTHILL